MGKLHDRSIHSEGTGGIGDMAILLSLPVNEFPNGFVSQ